jgi:hypothetical protein
VAAEIKERLVVSRNSVPRILTLTKLDKKTRIFLLKITIPNKTIMVKTIVAPLALISRKTFINRLILHRKSIRKISVRRQANLKILMKILKA